MQEPTPLGLPSQCDDLLALPGRLVHVQFPRTSKVNFEVPGRDSP
jgi:hypothetical protein